MSHIEKILTKLRSVDWEVLPQPANSIALADASNYLRTFAIFLRECHADASAPMPFASPYNVLGVNEPLPPAIAAEMEILVGQSQNAYDGIYARHALEWAALCDASHPATKDHQDMFDPLLDLIAGRVPTGIRNGYWVVDENLFPLLNWLERYAGSPAPSAKN